MFFVAALVICLVIKFRFPKGKSIDLLSATRSENTLLVFKCEYLLVFFVIKLLFWHFIVTFGSIFQK